MPQRAGCYRTRATASIEGQRRIVPMYWAPMDTNLVNAAVGLQQASTMSRIQFAVARKVLDAQQMEGNAAIQLINAATGGVAKAGDAMVAAATGLGGQLDVTA
jgi:hypothetical protein